MLSRRRVDLQRGVLQAEGLGMVVISWRVELVISAADIFSTSYEGQRCCTATMPHL